MATGDAEPVGDVDVERRLHDRLPILGEFAGEVMVFQPMIITEIGCGGIQVETTFAFHLDSLHDLRLTLGDHAVVVKGRVTYCRIVDVDQESLRYCSGFQFVELPEHVSSVISGFVDAINTGRRGL
jgi:hypothetical protein